MNRGLRLGIMELVGWAKEPSYSGQQIKVKLMPNREGQQGIEGVKGRGEGRRGSGRESSM